MPSVFECSPEAAEFLLESLCEVLGLVFVAADGFLLSEQQSGQTGAGVFTALLHLSQPGLQTLLLHTQLLLH